MPLRIRLIFTGLNVVLFLIAAAPIFRNWDRVRTEQFGSLLASAAVSGAMLMLLVLVVTGRLAYRGETGPRP